MIPTYGLTHISLAVRDLDRTLHFYQQLFGCKEVYRDANSVQAQTPGSHDVLAFEVGAPGIGAPGGIAHFGFRLLDASDIDEAVREAKKAGGKLLRRGEFCPGCPFAYVADPDGYEIEIWFEP